MRYLLFIAVFTLAAFQVQAQSERTLSGGVRGAFVAPIFHYGKIDGHTGYGAGAGVGLSFRHGFFGFFGQGELFDFPAGNNPDRALGLGYGGIWLGVNVPSYRAIHVFASVKAGAGAAGVGEWRRYSDDWHIDFDDPDLDDGVLVAAPEAGLELNLTHWMRLSGAVGYRYVDGFKGFDGIDKQIFNAPYYSLTLRLGWFGHRSYRRSGECRSR